MPILWPTPSFGVDSLQTAEPISGVRAVSMISGRLVAAQPGSGLRMPAMGVVTEDVASGVNTFYVFDAQFRVTSGLDISGTVGQPVFVGSGGVLVLEADVPANTCFQQLGYSVSGGFDISAWQYPSRYSMYSGQIKQSHLADASVLSGNIGSGQIASGHMASGFISALGSATLTSGQVSSGFLGDASVTSGSYASGSISRFTVASGSLLGFELGSGAITSGRIASGQLGGSHYGSGSVRSGTIGSGQIGLFHLSVTEAPDGTKFLRDDYSWQAISVSLGSGDVGSGKIASGAVQGLYGDTRHIASGTVGGFDLGSGAVEFGAVGSGAVASGNIGSGQVGFRHYALASVQATVMASGSVLSGNIGSGQVGRFHVASGQLAGFELGSGAIVSGRIASGQVGQGHLASGFLISGFHIGSGTVHGQLGGNPFQIVSGTVGGLNLGSGIITNLYLGSGAVQSGSYASGSISNFKIAANAITSGHVGSGTLLAGLSFVMDGGGAAITAGAKGYVEVPFNCVLESVSLFGDRSGQMFFGIWKDTYANWPPTSGDTITTSGVPILSGQTAKMLYSGGNISGWNLVFTKGDVLSFQVYSNASGMQAASVCLALGRT